MNNNNKNNLKMSKKVRLSKKPSFAAKLGAFLLEGLSGDVKFSESGGFSMKQSQVTGALPLLHMNIKEAEFKKMLSNAKSVNTESISGVCNKNNLDKVLSSVGFNCISQSKQAVDSLNQGLVDSINNRWSIRKNGQKKVKQVLEKMSWQVANDIIPKSSVQWSK